MKELLQECLICNYKCIWKPKNKEEEDTIRASCLPCGHQGAFTLKENSGNTSYLKDQ